MAVRDNPVLLDGMWECGDQRFLDPSGIEYEALFTPLTVDVIIFKLLFTSAERVKAEELRETDATIKDFWSILDDPRTANVVMALPSIQNVIEYTLTAINASGVTLDVQARKAAILAGQVS
jgi:hypothetical protein